MKRLLPLVLLPLLCAACGDEEEPRETEPQTNPLRSAACDAGTPPMFSGVLVLPGAPTPLPNVKARVEYADDMRVVDGPRRVIVSLGGSGLRESPLPFALCGAYEEPQTLTHATFTAFVDMNGNDERDEGDYVHVEVLDSETPDLTNLTLTLTRI